jgi:hypothetical protein
MITLSESALIRRINRKLRHDETILKKARDCLHQGQWYEDIDLGRYYTVNFNNHLVGTHIDLERFGRELGVLSAGEEIAAQ